ncbi:MAG: type IV pili twitching motility protein PilT [Planctomycetes bacterium]|jgi:twitching motility protein PilT|nr:type IV pili twitching motility protein PilT [Planctomycetota bacterium]
MAQLDKFFEEMIRLGASDLHLTTGLHPYFRLDGDMAAISGAPAMNAAEMRRLLFEIAPEGSQKQFDEECDTDFAYELPGRARFRANFFMDMRGPGAVFRQIPEEILTLEQLDLPKAVRDLCFLSKGLVLVTGPTGSGKSTTLAAMIDFINKRRSDHIITIEDPIEFVHKSQKSLVHQREVGRHTESFKRALRAALREDPDIVLVGEMRDLETVEIAIETAETGHLVFGTLHTTTAMTTVDRIIDQFPAGRQAQIRTMLAASLKGVIAQTLCKKKSKGRIAALEILITTKAVAALVREGKTHQILSAMQTGAKFGMKLLNDSLVDLVKDGLVDPNEAYIKAVDKDSLMAKLQHIGVSVDLGAVSEGNSPGEAAAAPALQLDPQAPMPASPEPEIQAETHESAPGGYRDPFQLFRKKRNN